MQIKIRLLMFPNTPHFFLFIDYHIENSVLALQSEINKEKLPTPNDINPLKTGFPEGGQMFTAVIQIFSSNKMLIPGLLQAT